MSTFSTKGKWFIVLSFILVLYWLYIPNNTSPEYRLRKENRTRLFFNFLTSLPNLTHSEEIAWKRRKSLSIQYSLLQRPPHSWGDDLLTNQLDYCSSLSFRKRMMDFRCRADWLRRLRTSPVQEITRVDTTTSTNPHLYFVLDDSTEGLFKPCSSDITYPETEVVASHLDFLLGYDQIFPAISRNLTASWLARIPRRDLDIQRLIRECGSEEDGVLYGTMIGRDTRVLQQSMPQPTFLSSPLLSGSSQNVSGSTLEYLLKLSSHALRSLFKSYIFEFIIGSAQRDDALKKRSRPRFEYLRGADEFVGTRFDDADIFSELNDDKIASRMLVCRLCGDGGYFDQILLPIAENLVNVTAFPKSGQLTRLLLHSLSLEMGLLSPKLEEGIFDRRASLVAKCLLNCEGSVWKS
eukprot:TRINITY_DN4180_c0_g1_i1.p1 TRINITY_DN4180_c0_g1~~TRINITY_DN4180_c0_g1_i1.p1  ORF type:complete len:408 (-),score=72.48 TRINITY_DN4180_c0_g1_i1:13-1236(-)